ncbi:MAG TPA: permease-like cell division protein FtsX [bacterium]|nr:permease-like cell division protein FtsX [bacterium]
MNDSAGGRRRDRPRRIRPLGLRYALAEGAQGFVRNGLMSAASVVITAVTLLALGAALAVAGALNHVAAGLEQQLQVVVYLKSGAGPEEVASLRRRLERLPGVAGVEYVSAAEALARLEAQLGARGRFRDLLVRNPLPASFVVTATRADRLRAIAVGARNLPAVDEVRDGGRVLDRLLVVTRAVRLVGIAAGAILASVALIVIAGTIRLTVFARRAEIEVMRLVGATAWFIRWPFVVEGAVTGACGACGAAVAVAAGYGLLVRSAARALPFVPLPDLGQVAFDIVWKLLAWGVVIGVTASLLAVRRYVRV